MNLTDRIAQDGITADVSGGSTARDESGWDYFAYTVTLHLDGCETFVTPFKTGIGWTTEPTVSDVLDSLLSDAATVENSTSFEEWAAELGFDPDSRKAEKTYRECVDQTNRLRAFLGDYYDAYVWETDRE